MLDRGKSHIRKHFRAFGRTFLEFLSTLKENWQVLGGK
jgi:hypothetical protein